MPRKYALKSYLEDGFYHIYNRGVEKRDIFLTNQDYKIFLYILKKYLDPKEKINPKTSLVNPMNLADEIDLVAYCLMPNHFHFLIHQKNTYGIKKIMQRIMTNYVMYFNRRINRVGPLFQSVYKGILVETDEYLMQLSRYIHLNPLQAIGIKNLATAYSSYGDYLGLRHTNWVKPGFILKFFSKDISSRNSYQSFIESGNEEHFLKSDLCLDEEI